MTRTYLFTRHILLSNPEKDVLAMDGKKIKVVKGVALTGELWEHIDATKSSQMSRSTYIGVAVEDYIKRMEAGLV